MASTYVNNLRLEEIGTGEQSGTWGDTTNTNLEIIGQAVAWGTRAIADASTDNITIADGALDADRCLGLKLTGGGQACTVSLLPNTSSKTWFMYNATSAALTFTCGGGADVIIPAGQTKVIATDGLGSGGVVHDLLTAVNLAGTTVVDDLTVSDDLTVTDDLIVGGDIDLEGSIDVNGTANLDIVDIDGAVNMATTALVTGVLTTTAATVFNGGFASNAPSTISHAGNGYQLRLTSTDADASVGPALDLYRNSASPANNDFLGNITFRGRNNNSQDVQYAEAEVYITDVADGAEDGLYNLNVMTNGSNMSYLQLRAESASVVFNEDSNDMDFRVESNANINMLFVDGGGGTSSNGLVTIGGLSGTAGNQDAGYFPLQVGNTAASSTILQMLSATDGACTIHMGDGVSGAARYDGYVSYNNNTRAMILGTAGATQMTLTSAALTLATGTDLITTTAGSQNFRAGVGAGDAIASGANYNVAVGDGALTSDDLGSFNTAVGRNALNIQNFASATNSHNTAVGANAGEHITTGLENTIVGSLAADALQEGQENVVVGYNALSADTTGSRNVAVGQSTLRSQNMGGSSVVLSYNTAVGFQAGINLTDGTANTFLGMLSAGNGVVTGDHNTAVGGETLYSLTSGIDNTIMGYQAGSKITTGAQNVAIGREALETEDTGSHSTAVGYLALRVQNYDAACQNTALGYQAGVAVQTGIHNTLLGSFAGHNVVTGSQNTILGYNLAVATYNNTASIVIGSNITGGGSNVVRIGTSAGNATLALDGSDTSWAASSDSRLKKDVADCAVGLDFIKDLRPITYKWDAKDAIANTLPQYDADSSDPVYGSGKTQHGFIAQEVKTAIDAHSGLKNGFTMWSEDPNGTQQIAPAALIPMLVNAIQELEARIAVLEG